MQVSLCAKFSLNAKYLAALVADYHKNNDADPKAVRVIEAPEGGDGSMLLGAPQEVMFVIGHVAAHGEAALTNVYLA
jgi:hypothetical protein